VHQNMSFGLRLRKYPKAKIESRVAEAARILSITDLLGRRPRQLSGGQRQRVAMGRAIVRDPKVFLFDEPLSNLDAKLRGQMRIEIKRIHQQVRTTTVYVTHDQVEAMTLADRVVVMNDGLIEQVGTPSELYDTPSTRFVAGFIGSPAMNFVPCELIEGDNGAIAAKVDDVMTLPLPADRGARYRDYLGRPMVLGIRPEHVRERRPSDGAEGVECVVSPEVVEPLGMETMVYFSLNGSDLCARVAPEASPSPGAPLTLSIDPRRAHLIDPETDLVL
jgi:multiple sugar transport system ATP-binding protein